MHGTIELASDVGQDAARARAYATPLTDEVRPDLRPWQDGLIRCHYPLGDATRDARIAADRHNVAKTREAVP